MTFIFIQLIYFISDIKYLVLNGIILRTSAQRLQTDPSGRLFLPRATQTFFSKGPHCALQTPSMHTRLRVAGVVAAAFTEPLFSRISTDMYSAHSQSPANKALEMTSFMPFFFDVEPNQRKVHTLIMCCAEIWRLKVARRWYRGGSEGVSCTQMVLVWGFIL